MVQAGVTSSLLALIGQRDTLQFSFWGFRCKGGSWRPHAYENRAVKNWCPPPKEDTSLYKQLPVAFKNGQDGRPPDVLRSQLIFFSRKKQPHSLLSYESCEKLVSGGYNLGPTPCPFPGEMCRPPTQRLGARF